MLWIPKAQKLMMLGGHTVNSTTGYSTYPYRSLTLEAWTYDEKADAWTLVRRFENVKNAPASPHQKPIRAAIADDDQAAVVDATRKLCEFVPEHGDFQGLAESNFREAVYLTKEDAVMIGATGFLYDCAKNEWFRYSLPSDSPPITKEGACNIGVMYDAKRDLIWAVNTNSQVFVLRFDRSAKGLEPIRLK